MNQLNNKKTGYVWTISITVILWILLILWPPPFHLYQLKFALLFYGIGKLMLILGLIVFVTICFWQQYVLRIKQSEYEKAELEISFRKINLEKQMADAELRRQHDRLIHHDIAIARLLESATIKNADEIEPIVKPTKDSSDESKKCLCKETHSKNQVDMEAFQLAVDSYHKFISEQ